MEATREDLIRNLQSSNEILRIFMSSDASWDQRYRAWEQLGRNMRTMGVDEAVIAAIPVPASNYHPPAPAPAPWTPPPLGRHLSDEEVLMPTVGF